MHPLHVCHYATGPWVRRSDTAWTRDVCLAEPARLVEAEGLPPLWLCRLHADLVLHRPPGARVETEPGLPPWTEPEPEWMNVAVFGAAGQLLAAY